MTSWRTGHFSIFGLVICTQVVSKKCALLTLKPRSHGRIFLSNVCYCTVFITNVTYLSTAVIP